MIMNKYLNNTLTGKENLRNGRAFWATTALFLNGCSQLLPGRIPTGPMDVGDVSLAHI